MDVCVHSKALRYDVEWCFFATSMLKKIMIESLDVLLLVTFSHCHLCEDFLSMEAKSHTPVG